MGKTKGEDPKPKKSGCLRMGTFLVTLAVLGLSAAVYFTFEPQDLSDIEGYRPDSTTVPASGRNLEAVLKASLRNGMRATITEKEINDYLLQTLRLDQQGPLKGYVSLEGVWIRFQDGWAEVIIEREINVEQFQRRHTVAIHLEIEQLLGEGGVMTSGINPVGHNTGHLSRLTSPNAGRLGKVPVVEGYLRVVDASFYNILNLFPEISETFKAMLEAGMRIHFEEGRLVIAPAPEG